MTRESVAWRLFSEGHWQNELKSMGDSSATFEGRLRDKGKVWWCDAGKWAEDCEERVGDGDTTTNEPPLNHDECFRLSRGPLSTNEAGSDVVIGERPG